jgi:hypothetical protein
MTMPAREPRTPARRKTPRENVRERLDALAALASDPDGQAALAEEYVRTSTNMEVLRPALAVLQERADPDARPLLHDKYAWCEQSPERNDSGGFVRASIVRAMRPIIQPGDLALLQRALVSYQMVGMYEVCAELRGAALLALNDLDPDLAGLYAARFLGDPQNGNSGEPALSAIKVLVAQQNLAPVFAYASWRGGNGELVGEALRSLVDLPESLVPLLIATHGESEDEQVLLGLYDLLLGHPARASWRGVIENFMNRTRLLDLYGLVAMQIVVTRDGDLIEMLRELERDERDPFKGQMLRQALEHA